MRAVFYRSDVDEGYCSLLHNQLLTECKRLYPNDDFIFMQDGASRLTSNASQDFLKEAVGNCFIKENVWPPYSPACNVPDFYLWNELME